MTAVIDRRSVLAAIALAARGLRGPARNSAGGLLSVRVPRICVRLRPDHRPGARDSRARPSPDRPRSASPAGRLRRAVPAGNDRRERRRATALSGSSPAASQSATPWASVARKRSIFAARPSSAERPNGRRWSPTGGHDSPNADLCALRERAAGRHRQSAGSARALSVPRQSGHLFPPARNQRTGDDRRQGVERVHPPVQSRHHRSLQPRSGRRAGRGPAGRRAPLSANAEAGHMAITIRGPGPAGPYGGPPGPYPGPYYQSLPPWGQ